MINLEMKQDNSFSDGFITEPKEIPFVFKIAYNLEKSTISSTIDNPVAFFYH